MPDGRVREESREKRSSEMKLKEKWPQAPSVFYFLRGHDSSDIWMSLQVKPSL